METVFSTQFIADFFRMMSAWFLENVLVIGNLVQVAVVLLLVLFGNLLGKRFQPRLPARVETLLRRNVLLTNLFGTVTKLLPTVYALVLIGISALLYRQLGISPVIVNLVATLLLAWIVIKLATAVIPDPFWSRSIAIGAWSLAALNILGILRPAAAFLDRLGFRIGEVNITVLSLIQTFSSTSLFTLRTPFLGSSIQNPRSNSTELFPNSASKQLGSGYVRTRGTSRAASRTNSLAL